MEKSFSKLKKGFNTNHRSYEFWIQYLALIALFLSLMSLISRIYYSLCTEHKKREKHENCSHLFIFFILREFFTFRNNNSSVL